MNRWTEDDDDANDDDGGGGAPTDKYTGGHDNPRCPA